jgi:D-alanyl-D-alanine carboxypeptidase
VNNGPNRPSLTAGDGRQRGAVIVGPHESPSPAAITLMGRGERLYALLALVACVAVLAAHFAGRAMEDAEKRQGWAALAEGRDPAAERDVLLSAVAGLASMPARQSVDRDAAPAALPAWVQALRRSELWSDSAAGQPVGRVGQWQFLSVMAAEASRLRVQLSGLEGGAVEGWIDLNDVGLSGPPPQWVRTVRQADLYTSSEGSDNSVVAPVAADLMVLGEARSDRLFVYLPVEITSRRSGYGWIDQDAVMPSTQPADGALPSPTFRPVPVGRQGNYRVRTGDSIASIATDIGVGRDELLRSNGLDPAAQLLVGQVLQIPTTRPPSDADAPGPRKVRDLSPGWVSAQYAVVVDGDSGQILWARDANTATPPASLTKIITALVVLDHANLGDTVVVGVDSRRMTGSTVMGVHPGDVLTVEDLLYGLMLPSGNDAALALAQHVAGTREAFVDLMNEKVRSLGLTGSQFVNPHGLDAPGHLSTAYDMAMLGREGMRNSIFQELAAARTYETPRGGGFELHNLNQLLWRYQDADGVKIGYTPAAGRTIVASATRGGHRVYVAAMQSNDIYADSAALLDWTFASYSWQ